MSKPSIRTGSSSIPSTSRSEASDSTRRARRCSRRSRSWSRARRALRSASSRSRRLSPRSAARTSTGEPRRSLSASARQLGALAQVGADDDHRRHRRRGRVVLADELLGDLGRLALGLVLEVEALALGEDPVADLEDLGVGVGPLDRDADQVGGADRAAGDALALEQRADRLQPVAVQRRALEFLGAGGLLHLRPLLGLDLAVAAGEEVDDRVDVAPVLLVADVADAGRPAALDVVVEAGAAGAAAGLGPLAGAELEQLAEQVERLPHPLGAGEGAEVGAAGAVLLAGEVDPRVLLVEADADVGVGLVVAQADVEVRPVALDEALLGEQRLGLGRGDEGVDAVDARGQAGCCRRRSARRPVCGSSAPCRRRAASPSLP